MKIKIYYTLIFFVSVCVTANAQHDTLYILQHGEIINKYNVNTQIDSIIFYNPGVENAMTITEYVQKHDQYSEFKNMLEYSGLKGLLNEVGPFTLFLPTNDAIHVMYTEMNVSSYSEFEDKDFVKDFIYNHILVSALETSQIGFGAITETNLLGDYIASDGFMVELRPDSLYYDLSIQEVHNLFFMDKIRLNKMASIIEADIELTNGYIHVVDNTIPITDKSVYQTLKAKPEYSLFVKGLEMTGLSDTLDLITFDRDRKARTHYTILAVADTTFNRYGIMTAEDLVAYFTNEPSRVGFYDNSFYQYMVYHCLQGTHYFSNLQNSYYPVISSENNVKIEIAGDYRLDHWRTNNMDYTSFIIDASNHPAKNGVIHTLTDLLLPRAPVRTRVEWEVTDQLEIKAGSWYQKDYKKWFDGENSFENIKFEGDYVQYYFRDHDTGPLLNDDCLTMKGFWTIEITTPNIMKGRYKVSGNIWRNLASYKVYIDGKKVGTTNSYDAPDFGIHNWDKTERHTIKLVATKYGSLYWDTLTFTPVD